MRVEHARTEQENQERAKWLAEAQTPAATRPGMLERASCARKQAHADMDTHKVWRKMGMACAMDGSADQTLSK